MVWVITTLTVLQETELLVLQPMLKVDDRELNEKVSDFSFVDFSQCSRLISLSVRHSHYLLILVNLLGGDTHAARREFLSYCLSLMRAHNSEHLDSLPVLDVSALKHVAYVFDALIYFMRSGSTEGADNEVRREGLPLPPWNDQVVYQRD